MKRHKCGLELVALRHPLKLVTCTDAAFKAQLEEPIGLAFRGLAVALCEDKRCVAAPIVLIGMLNPPT